MIRPSLLLPVTALVAPLALRPQATGRCVHWVGTPSILREARALVGARSGTWASRRFVYDIAPAPTASVRLIRDTATCAQALAAYSAARTQGVSGPPDSLPLRLLVVRGRDFFLVEDSLSAAGAAPMREVAIFHPDWRYHMSYGSGS